MTKLAHAAITVAIFAAISAVALYSANSSSSAPKFLAELFSLSVIVSAIVALICFLLEKKHG